MMFNSHFYKSVDFWSGVLILLLMVWDIMPVRLTSVFWWVSLALVVGGLYYVFKGLFGAKKVTK
ncbi:hypothetical protein [Levilactobacillus koreensis]|uniref:Uncharacterized protein n=1 Tax=Levilactobacillus koreensis TaxID=637971 RepID=A0AAC9ERD4_9LACO|nr:hypothetical protein [Levilactobacillus koreensis]AKP64634.1 hypothetical protein ABN16_06270 [Levilactobacillus koreensis]